VAFGSKTLKLLVMNIETVRKSGEFSRRLPMEQILEVKKIANVHNNIHLEIRYGNSFDGTAILNCRIPYTVKEEKGYNFRKAGSDIYITSVEEANAKALRDAINFIHDNTQWLIESITDR
jgi:hypothetical protein